MRKLIITASLIMVFFITVILFEINTMLVQKASSSLPRVVEKTVAEEAQHMNYAIPNRQITSSRELQERMYNITEKRRIFKVKELEAEGARAARRARASSLLRAREATLMNTDAQDAKKESPPNPLPEINAEPPSEEELKEMENNGIISY